LKIPITLLLEL